MPERDKARWAGLTAAILLTAVLVYMLFAGEPLVAVDDGAYVNVTQALGLEETESGEYAFRGFDVFSILQPGAPSIALPTAIARLILEPLGLRFTTQALCAVYIAILALAAYLLVGGLALRSTSAACAAGFWLVVALSRVELMGYLNSLYPMGAAIVFSVLFIGLTAHALCEQRGAGFVHVAGVAVGGILMVSAAPQMIVFLPAACIALVASAVHCCPCGPKRLAHGIGAVGCALVLCLSSVVSFTESKEVFSPAANYLAVFEGFLPNADRPLEALDSLGLDRSYLADIGKSYYADAESFVHNPRVEQEFAREKLSLAKRIRLLMRHPEIYDARMEELSTHLLDGYNTRIQTAGGKERVYRLTPAVIASAFTGQGGEARYSRHMLVAGAFFLVCAIAVKRARGRYLTYAALAFGAAAFVPVGVVLTGGADIDRVKVLFIFFGFASAIGLAAGAVSAGEALMDFCARRQASVLAARPYRALNAEKKALPLKNLLAICAAVCVIVAAFEYLPKHHVGGVNNGDFGRMMEQIDLYWQTEQLEKSEQQLAYGVIEHYDFREPFHFERLTSADPTYSLLFLGLPVRLITGLLGLPFDTRAVAIMLSALTLACLMLILSDLYPLLGRAVYIPAAGLTCMMFSESYLAWYNSLFGEGSVCVGMAMLLACGLHLALMPKGDKRAFVWMALWLLAVRCLTCAKAQMLTALPTCLVLTLVLALYHRPQRIKQLAAYSLCVVLGMGIVAWDTVRIYQKDSEISSRVTVWASVFYGAAMIADDPAAVLDELGIDPALVADVGKDGYQENSVGYVYHFDSEEMDEAFFNRFKRTDIVFYYLRYPLDMIKMLDRAAQESIHYHNGFMAYTGEVYSDASGLHGFTIWQNLRTLTAPRAFWQYVLLYGAAIVICIRVILRGVGHERMLAALFLGVMFIGVLQYPLSVLGNGYADNNKQLSCFMYCHDILVLTTLTLVVRTIYLRIAGKEREMRREEKENEE